MLPFLSASLALREPPHPTTAEIAAAYRRADTVNGEAAGRVAAIQLVPQWLGDGAFWYRKDETGGRAAFVRVDARTGAKTPLFDAARLAAALANETGRTVDPDRLPLRSLRIVEGALRFEAEAGTWEFDAATFGLRRVDRQDRPEGARTVWDGDVWPALGTSLASPDGRWTARVEGGNVLLRGSEGGGDAPLTTDGTELNPYARLRWTGDSRRLIALRRHAGDGKKAYLVQNAPPEGGPAQLRTRDYDRPGDAVETWEFTTFDPQTRRAFRGTEPIDYVHDGEVPRLRPTKDGARFTYEKLDRGYGRWRLLSLDPMTGATTTLVDDDPPTFVDRTALFTRFLRGTDEIVYTSERDGWHHLWLADGKGGSLPITKGPWVVRSVERVDEARRRITFGASGMDPSEDPYSVHLYRIDFDGSHLVALTPAKGDHEASFSPDGTTFVDSVSTVQTPPIHTLRRAEDGAAVAVLERGDASGLLASGWKPPQPFVAKGRDGRTDIFGLVFRPRDFDPARRYPVVEDVYAGPQDSWVRKSFSATDYDQSIAELGFVVVRIDGMGTRNRSKAFHDVCYRKLADAGLPDRILWIKALAARDRSLDLTRVGIFGTSAGGQSAAGALLFHPEFYRVAVASCGCHDNRLDKLWWNEQRMGLLGPHYAASSNVENAARLRGDLLLIVGELDTNVPPESTYRFAAALQAAGKEFELVTIPNSDHTTGGPFGERKRRDFLVRHLLGAEPPNPNR